MERKFSLHAHTHHKCQVLFDGEVPHKQVLLGNVATQVVHERTNWSAIHSYVSVRYHAN